MHLELGLNEDDEYVRLQKLTLGIKEITLSIPTLSTYNDSYALKLQVFCSYPFQQHSVELLISIILDRFKNQSFVSAFHQALCEVAIMQEQRSLLSQRSLSLKSSRLTNLQNQSTDSRKSSQNSSFSKQVIQKIIVAKKFASTYLKQIFTLANDLNMDLEKLARVFKIFIINTKDQDFRIKIISIFDECKNDIFGHTQWVEQYYEEIDTYFLQNHLQNPTNVQEYTNEKPSSKVAFFNFCDPPDDSDESDEEQIENIIQKWLCETETYEAVELENILNQPENYDQLIKYITLPEKNEISKCWTTKYSDLKLQFHDHQTYYKFMDRNIKIEETIRSYKALQVIIKDENASFFNEYIPQNVIQIFNGVYDFVNEQTHNANLNHIAKLIENALYKHPKLSVVQIVDLNLYFSLSFFLYNDMIKILLEDIINIKIDKFKLGYFFQEQLWKYLCKTNWFKFIAQLMLKEGVNMAMIDKCTKCEATISILSILRTLSTYDNKLLVSSEINVDQKEKLTNLLGMLQAGKTPESFYTINQLNWQLNLEIPEHITFQEIVEKDIDNLKQFVQERKNDTVIKQHFLEIKNMKQRKSALSQVEVQQLQHAQDVLESPSTSRQQKKNNNIIIRRKSQTKIISKFSTPSSLQSSPISPIGAQHSPGLQALTQIQRLDTVDESFSNSFKRQQQKSSFLYHSSKYRNRTEGNFTNEGFSSSRLKTIYPSYKTSIENTEYERQLKCLQFDQKYFSHGLSLLLISTKSIFEFLKQNDDKQKQSLNRLDITTICKCFLSEELFDKYFQIYLLDILENKSVDDNVADDCGIFINLVFKNVLDIKQLMESRKGLCNSFLNACEYLCKIIFDMHKNPNFLVSTKHKFKKTLLMTTINLGFQLVYLQANHIVEKFIVKYLNESVIHIMIIWFFDSDQNSMFQRNFFIFLYMLLNTAHSSLISTLFFKIGFISSLQNAYSRFFVNGIKNDSNYENLFCFIQLIIQIILNVLRKRQLVQLEKNLESMESWNILTNNKSYQEPKLLIHFNKKIFQQFEDNNEIIQQKSISFSQKVVSMHEDNQYKEKRGIDLLNSRKSLLFTPKLIPISPQIPNKQKQQSIKA